MAKKTKYKIKEEIALNKPSRPQIYLQNIPPNSSRIYILLKCTEAFSI